MKPDAFWQQIEQELAKPAGDRDPAVFEKLQQKLDDEMRLPDNERNWHTTEAFGQWLLSHLQEGDPWDLSLLLPDNNNAIPFPEAAPVHLPAAASVAPATKPSPKTTEFIREAQERHELAQRYGVDDPAKEIDRYINRHETQLMAIAERYIEHIRDIVPGHQIVIGGSLAAGTMTAEGRDIDLRLLAAPGQDAPEALEQLSSNFCDLLPYVRTLHDTPDAKLIFLHADHIHDDQIEGEISVSLSIQPEQTYYNLAGKSRMLPAEQRHRLIIAKALAHKENDTEYRRVKKHWVDLIYWLNERKYFDTSNQNLRQNMLHQAQFLFPLFFKHPRQR